MKPEELGTKEINTWCPGCPNFSILQAVKEALSNLANQGKLNIENVAMVTGIGCHAKIYDYLNLKGFYGIHGRTLPIAFGVKLGNPGLTVIGFGGDGDTYAEGMEHFIHNCRYNADLTMLVHNNQVFSLTTGQFTPTTEKGFKDGSSPLGLAEKPINPLVLAIEAGASFVARGFALDVPHLGELITQAVMHKGFSFIDILQPCIVYHKYSLPYFNKNVYKLENHDVTDFASALTRAREWDYSYEKDVKIPVGIFYKKERPVFESQWPQLKGAWSTIQRKINWQNVTKEFK
ncbi:MAG: thiamine pyrophosphate-dependent enzyme [Candidatus Nealsonbacteria bacterium]|nr:thiamine pyrophosphate-dependent enzyme [Candidatus Nealsonbacteria bacterium]